MKHRDQALRVDFGEAEASLRELLALVEARGGDPALEGAGLDQSALDSFTDHEPLKTALSIEALAERSNK